MQGESTDPRRLPGNSFPEIHRFHESPVGSTGSKQEKLVPTTEAGIHGDIRQEARKAIRARTISEIENLEHFPSDEDLLRYMQLRQTNPDASSYKYWVQYEPTSHDRHDLELPAIADFYSGLADFIKSKIKPVRLPGYQHSQAKEDDLRKSLDDYRLRIEQKEQSFRNLVNQGIYPDMKYPAGNDFIFSGLFIEAAGRMHDLSKRTWAGDLISNIGVDRKFVYYATENMSNQFVTFADRELPVHHRIYLNPKISRTIEVAGQLSDALDAENLQAMYKIMNRAQEATRKKGQVLEIRSEGIVVYCNKYHTNRVLEIILECFESNYEAFKDRLAPKLATDIAPGIAVATEEGLSKRYSFKRYSFKRYSFNGHRAAIISDAWGIFKQQESLISTISHQDLGLFKQILQGQFRRYHVDPRNISFHDLSASSYDIL